MRVVVAAVAAAVSCCFASTAGAAGLPPISGFGGVHIVKLAPLKQTARSCAAHSRSRTAVGKLSRRARPVACEQPPRANVLDVGFALVFKP